MPLLLVTSSDAPVPSSFLLLIGLGSLLNLLRPPPEQHQETVDTLSFKKESQKTRLWKEFSALQGN